MLACKGIRDEAESFAPANIFKSNILKFIQFQIASNEEKKVIARSDMLARKGIRDAAESFALQRLLESGRACWKHAKIADFKVQKLSTFPHVNIYAKRLIFMHYDGLWGLCGQFWISYPHFHIKFVAKSLFAFILVLGFYAFLTCDSQFVSITFYFMLHPYAIMA